MQDEFSEILQRLVSWVEPDPARFRQGLLALHQITAGADPPAAEQIPLQSTKKCDIPEVETDTGSGKVQESGEKHENEEKH